ncbi:MULTISPECIES: CpaF family protein [unclassified Methylophilus]|uniref:CpaF family protein n=1 Tax=unclassified Methylophilus TaxID=2630143 RepID=UPI000363C01F|nr:MULTISPECIES: CpaF family protein [unclassified Methylophilus]HCU85661.1 CpaF family protein [Methylophilus sp.]
MSLREKLQSTNSSFNTHHHSLVEGGQDASGYSALKRQIHTQILDRINLEKLATLSDEQIKKQINELVSVIVDEQSIALNTAERGSLARDIQYEMFGLGPLEPLLSDPAISDILVNGYNQVYIERKGMLELTQVQFQDNQHLLNIIERIVSQVGRRVDESSPMVDARLADGSRVNAIIPPLALDGPVMSIRRFSVSPLLTDDLIKLKTMTPQMANLISAFSKSKMNAVISGGTGSGKTTMLNLVSGFIPKEERIVTIEDAAELRMQQPHVVRLETRPPNIENKGEVTQTALVRNALRMRPDRIILGEVRGAEALDMLQAMNTGHEGSFATIHANSPRDALARMENMVGMAGANLTLLATRQQIAAAINVIIQVSRLVDGTRKIVSIQEITGMEGETIAMQEIYGFRQTGVDEQGKVRGYFYATGVVPTFMQRLKSYGAALLESDFDPTVRYEV